MDEPTTRISIARDLILTAACQKGRDADTGTNHQDILSRVLDDLSAILGEEEAP